MLAAHASYIMYIIKNIQTFIGSVGEIDTRYLPRGEAPYNGLYGEAPPDRGIFFMLHIYERVVISLVEVHKRVGRSVIWVFEKA